MQSLESLHASQLPRGCYLPRPKLFSDEFGQRALTSRCQHIRKQKTEHPKGKQMYKHAQAHAGCALHSEEKIAGSYSNTLDDITGFRRQDLSELQDLLKLFFRFTNTHGEFAEVTATEMLNDFIGDALSIQQCRKRAGQDEFDVKAEVLYMLRECMLEDLIRVCIRQRASKQAAVSKLDMYAVEDAIGDHSTKICSEVGEAVRDVDISNEY